MGIGGGAKQGQQQANPSAAASGGQKTTPAAAGGADSAPKDGSTPGATPTGVAGAETQDHNTLQFRLPKADEPEHVLRDRVKIIATSIQTDKRTKSEVNDAFRELIIRQPFVRKERSIVLIICLIIVILIVGGIATYYIMDRKNSNKEDNSVHTDEEDLRYSSSSVARDRSRTRDEDESEYKSPKKKVRPIPRGPRKRARAPSTPTELSETLRSAKSS